MNTSLAISSKLSLQVIFIALALVAFPILVKCGLTKFDAQLVIAPFFIYSLWKFGAPRLALIPLALFWFIALTPHLGIHFNSQQKVYIARASSDPILKKTLENKKYFNEKSTTPFILLAKTAKNPEEATALATKINSPVIWQYGRKTTFTPPKYVETGSDLVLERVAGMKPILDISKITIAFAQLPEGQAFARRLATSYVNFKQGFPEGELQLILASQARGRWRSRTHLAYPLFVLGTSYLRTSFSYGASPVPNLKCATFYLEKAKKLLNDPVFSLELSAAINNNLAVSFSALYSLTGSNKYKARSALFLSEARRITLLAGKRKPDDLTAIPVENYLINKKQLDIKQAKKMKKAKKHQSNQKLKPKKSKTK